MPTKNAVQYIMNISGRGTAQVICTRWKCYQSGWQEGFGALNPTRSLLIHSHDSPWPYRCSHCTKIWQKNYLHDIWCLIFKINTGQLCSITEIVPKSLFLCMNRSPIRYNFPAGTKVIRCSVGLNNLQWTLDLSLPE